MRHNEKCKKETYQKLKSDLYDATLSYASNSMSNAAKDLRKDSTDGKTEFTVMVDGTWQRRGHSSLNGVVTAISMDNGKVLELTYDTFFFRPASPYQLIRHPNILSI